MMRASAMSRTKRVLAAVVTAALAVAIWMFVLPTELGGQVAYHVVSGQSMEPSYHTGDLVITRAESDYAVGDVVAYQTDHGRVIHRIVGTEADSEFVLQGDNNEYLDTWTPTKDQILGKEWVHLPGVGEWILRIRHVVLTPPFTYLLAAFAFLAIVLKDDARREPDEADAIPGEDGVHAGRGTSRTSLGA